MGITLNEHIKLLKRSKSSWLYPIYVPSAFRAGTAPLLNMLEKASHHVRRRVKIVTLPSQEAAYRRAYPWAKVLVERTPGIGPARMRCLLDADVWGYKYITVLDDDIIHVSLLQATVNDSGKPHTRRFSASVSGVPEPMLLIRSLAVACRMSSVLFRTYPAMSYGAARNALFSGDVDVSVGASMNKGSFPACVMFFDTSRFKMRAVPTPYQYHGEDLAMFLDQLTNDYFPFTLPGVAYDQHGSIESTIPLDPQDAVGRPHLETTHLYYPDIHPYLRVSMKNKLGGVMRIGVNWSQWYKNTFTGPVDIPLVDIIKEI